MQKKHPLYWFSLAAMALLLNACSSNDDEQAATSSSAKPKAQVITTSANKISDASGQEFVARGINLNLSETGDKTDDAIKSIAKTGANTVRLQLSKKVNAQQLDSAIATAVKQGLVVMPVLVGDAGKLSCTADPKEINDLAQRLWLGDWKDVLLKKEYKKHLMLNIASQWGPTDVWSATNQAAYEPWVKTYEGLIGQFRDAGFEQPLVIDAPGCGQDYNAFLAGRGRRLLKADAQANIVLSVNAYEKHWKSRRAIVKAVSILKSTGMPFIATEFGGSGYQADASIDHNEFLKQAAGIGARDPWGWIASSWNSLDNSKAMLNISKSASKLDTTERGKLIVEGEFGLQKTAQPARFN